jgi:TonB family protein
MVRPAAEEPAPPPPPPPTIVPPSLLKDDGATYPPEAVRAGVRDVVAVDVIVDVDSTGRVRKAVVESPVGNGFDEAAIAAAEKLVFQPATRNGQPIAARIKHRYVFAPPAARLSGRVVRRAADQPLANADVVVRGADGREFRTQTAPDGTWSVDALPFGEYRIEVAAQGYAAASADEALNPGEEANIVFRLAPGAVPPPVVDLAPGEVVEEVRVRGERPPREVTKRTLEQRELQRIPGTSGDALRAIQNLPGVARPPALAGLLIVRGSAPNATEVFVDGTPIPLVYHFGGLSSVVPTELLDRIDFYPGNFSAFYGRATGGIVDVAIRDPKKDRLHGLAQVDLIDARAIVEGPIGKGWSLAVAGRRSWIDAWLGPALQAGGATVGTAPVYYDYQAILQRDVRGGRLRFSFYGADDRIEVLVRDVNASDPGISGGFGIRTGFFRGQAEYKQRLGPDTDLRLLAAAGKNTVDFNLGDLFFRIDSYPITGRVELAQKAARGVTANVGLDMLYSPYDVRVRLPAPSRPGEPPGGAILSQPPLETSDSNAIYRPALYSEFEIVPQRGTRIVPGVRLDYAKDTKSWDLAPRFNARHNLGSGEFPRTTLKGGAGVFFQPPQPNETNRVFGVPGATSNRAIHYSAGVEREITRNLEVSFEGFYKQLDNFFTQRLGNVATGRAYGLETLIRYKPDSRFFGWLAYTLSRSVLRETPEEPERLASFDQTHILTVLGSYRLGRGWEIGARFRLVSGNLVTPRTYGFFDANTGVYLPLQQFPPNGERLPVFNQLDIRVDKVWRFPKWTLNAYLDLLNAYNQGNVEGVSYNYNFSRRSYATGLPIIPSLGLRAEF